MRDTEAVMYIKKLGALKFYYRDKDDDVTVSWRKIFTIAWKYRIYGGFKGEENEADADAISDLDQALRHASYFGKIDDLVIKTLLANADKMDFLTIKDIVGNVADNFAVETVSIFHEIMKNDFDKMTLKQRLIFYLMATYNGFADYDSEDEERLKKGAAPINFSIEEIDVEEWYRDSRKQHIYGVLMNNFTLGSEKYFKTKFKLDYRTSSAIYRAVVHEGFKRLYPEYIPEDAGKVEKAPKID